METSLLGPLCAFSSAVTWAVGSAGYSRLAGNNSAFSINFTRALVALPLSIIAVFMMEGGWAAGLMSYQNLHPSQIGWLSLSMVASYGLGDVLFLWSVQSLGLPGALAIASCFPIWTVAFGYIFSGDILKKMQFLGLFTTLAGVILIVLNGPEVVLEGKVATRARSHFSAKGLMLAFAASMCWAMNSYATALGGEGLSTHVGNTIRMFAGLILAAGFSQILAPGRTIFIPQKQLIGSLWLFVFEAFGGSYFYYYGMSHSSLVLGATLASLSPVISVPVALIWGIEKFSLIRTIGVGIVVLGICLLLGVI